MRYISSLLSHGAFSSRPWMGNFSFLSAMTFCQWAPYGSACLWSAISWLTKTLWRFLAPTNSHLVGPSSVDRRSICLLILSSFWRPSTLVLYICLSAYLLLWLLYRLEENIYHFHRLLFWFQYGKLSLHLKWLLDDPSSMQSSFLPGSLSFSISRRFFSCMSILFLTQNPIAGRRRS